MPYMTLSNPIPFRPAKPESIAEIERLIKSILKRDDVSVGSSNTRGSYGLSFDGDEVSEAFPDRILSLVQAMTPHVADGFMVEIYDDTDNLDDDTRRTQVFGGPNKSAIEKTRRNYYVTQALEILRTNSPKDFRIARAALDGKLPKPEDIRVMGVMKDGIVDYFIASHPVRAIIVDRDTGMSDDDQIVKVQLDGEMEEAVLIEPGLSVDADWCGEVTRLIDDPEIEREGERG